MTTDQASAALFAAEAVPGLSTTSGRILGRGLWGPTLDLGDGTVMKLVRGRAGIGDGLEICANEAHVLAALDGCRIDGFAIPRLVAHGRFGTGTDAVAAGFVAWLRMTRLPGVPFNEHKLSALSDGGRRDFAGSFGRAIAALHAGGASLLSRHALDDRCESLLLGLWHVSRTDRELCDRLLAEVRAMPTARRTAFVHGDMHLGNLLVDENGRVCGVIDFAEAGRGFPETDLAYLQGLPTIERDAFRAYQSAASQPLDEAAYHLAGAIYALTGAVIGELHGERPAARQDRILMLRCLNALTLSRR